MQIRESMEGAMSESTLDVSPPSRRGANLGLIVILSFLVVTQSSCSSMWQQVRERERVFAVESSRNQFRRGQCEAALRSLDRAQATAELGIFARESTFIRASCYERLGLAEPASAHRRLLSDFYDNETMPAPEPAGSSGFRVADIAFDEYSRPPSWLDIPLPRYSSYARRSGLIGRVIISFGLSKSGAPRMIRVLEMPHPLLASWAIEAIAQGKLGKSPGPVVVSGDHYMAVFDFEWRWAKEAEAGKGS
jgi:hypothetical protein